MLREWRNARRRARELRAKLLDLKRLPPVDDDEVVRFVMRSFDPPATAEGARQVFSDSSIDVSGCGFALHGRREFGLLQKPATTLLLRTDLASICLLELVFDGDRLGMCGVDMKHAEKEFIRISMNIEEILREECTSLGYDVPTWDGDLISFLRRDVEGMWWSHLRESGNTLRLVERRFGERVAAQRQA
jgi:hypothetical protein